MTDAVPDLTTTRFILPPDARVLEVAELSERLRSRIGPVDEGFSVVTRPGHRVAAQLVAGPLARLLEQFREPTRLTDGVLRFARSVDQDPIETLDLAFEALATLVETRVLVSHDSPDASAPVPSLAAGQAFATFEIEALVRSLDDSEVYRARDSNGVTVALKVTRDGRSAATQMLANESAMLDRLDGRHSPRLFEHGIQGDRLFVAMHWCYGVPIGVAAQRARSSTDRRGLHGLVTAMLDAYTWLHGSGVLHGDVHPGNCIVQDDGRVAILDYGNARSIDGSPGPVDPGRTGITHFYDPAMAKALLAGRLPPTASPSSEQYAIGVLAYMLLTGLHPIDSPAIRTELLERIVARPPRPFAAGGVAAWPRVEQVLARALAKQEGDRFEDVAALARAFTATVPTTPRPSPRWSPGVQGTYEDAVQVALQPRDHVGRDRGGRPRREAWFALRAAMAKDDPALLAAADVRARGLGSAWTDHVLVAHVARARSDSRTHADAIAGFVAAARAPACAAELGRMMAAAAGILTGDPTPGVDQSELVRWAAEHVGSVASTPPSRVAAGAEASGIDDETVLVHGVLALVASRAVATPEALRDRVEVLVERGVGDAWLWALAQEVYAEDQFASLALAAPRPPSPLAQALTAMRLHQVTGDTEWIDAAHRQVETAHRVGCPVLDIALLVAEASAPEQALAPPFAFP